VFFAREDIPPGQPYQEVIRDRLASSEVFLVILGRDWQLSSFENAEMEFARAHDIPIIPILLDSARLSWPYGHSAVPHFRVSEADFEPDVQNMIGSIERSLPSLNSRSITPAGRLARAVHTRDDNLSIDQMVHAARTCRLVVATDKVDGRGDVSQAARFDAQKWKNDAAIAIPLGRKEISEVELDGQAMRPTIRAWRDRGDVLMRVAGFAGGLLVSAGLAYSLRHELGALFTWIGGALCHNGSPPAPVARPQSDVVDAIAFAPESVTRGKRFSVRYLVII
jgi:hypothetical protein